MAYKNIDWINNITPLNANNMNNIMEGINLALGYTDGSEIPEDGITKPTIVYTKTEIDTIIGDIETALDKIIAIQNTLVGGEG